METWPIWRDADPRTSQGLLYALGLTLDWHYKTVTRLCSYLGSSGTIALGNGVVADIATSSERGTYMGLVMVSIHSLLSPHTTNQESSLQCGPMVGPAVGPILGGSLVNSWAGDQSSGC